MKVESFFLIPITQPPKMSTHGQVCILDFRNITRNQNEIDPYITNRLKETIIQEENVFSVPFPRSLGDVIHSLT
jgi:hypothetical protein